MACTNPTETSGQIASKLAAMQSGVPGTAFVQMSVYYAGVCQSGQLPREAEYNEQKLRYSQANIQMPEYVTLIADTQCLQQAMGKPPPVVPAPTAMEWVKANPIVAAGGAAVAVAALYWFWAKPRSARPNKKRSGKSLYRKNEYEREAEKLHKMLSEDFAHVEYDKETERGEARAGNLGLIHFRGSGNENAVIVEIPSIRFKTHADSAIEAIEQIDDILNSTGL